MWLRLKLTVAPVAGVLCARVHRHTYMQTVDEL